MSRRPEILLVEDNPADVDLLLETFEMVELDVKVNVARDGVEALEFLHRRGKFKDAPTPRLVLLDLNLPKVDGRAVLAEVKQAPGLRRIPVIVLSSSSSEKDMSESYDLHANAYVRKPAGIREYKALVRALDGFWCKLVKQPRSPA